MTLTPTVHPVDGSANLTVTSDALPTPSAHPSESESGVAALRLVAPSVASGVEPRNALYSGAGEKMSCMRVGCHVTTRAIDCAPGLWVGVVGVSAQPQLIRLLLGASQKSFDA